LMSEINGRYSRPGWVPIQYLYRRFDRSEIVAFYRAAEVALVTPLKDGMNLVAKEFCAAQIDDPGTLVLSEFAGAAHELKDGALLVNPYHVEGVADAILHACQMSPVERKRRMDGMRNQVRRHNVRRWSESFVDELQSMRSVPLSPTPMVRTGSSREVHSWPR
jgi:trehalose 6-phosphate synthase/phosphatase